MAFCAILAMLVSSCMQNASASAEIDDSGMTADYVLCGLGAFERRISVLIEGENLGSYAAVDEVSDSMGGRVLVISDENFPTGITKESCDQILNDGGSIVVLGNGEALRVINGLPAEVLSPTITLNKARMSIDETGNETVLSESVPQRVQSEAVFSLYCMRLSSAGEIDQRYIEVPSTRVIEKIVDVLRWAKEVAPDTTAFVDSAKSQELTSSAIEAELLESDTIGSDWTATNTYVYEYYHDETTLDIHIVMYFYKLNDIYSGNDYYLAEISTYTYIENYEAEYTGGVGWYLNYRYNKVDVNYYDDVFHHSDWLEFGPTTTLSGDSITYTVGLQVSSASVGGSVGVSRTVPKPDVYIYAEYSSTDEWIEWTEDFTNPSYTWYPVMTEPAEVSHYAYSTMHSIVIPIDGGASSSPNGLKMPFWYNFEICKDDNFDYYLLVLNWDHWSYTLNFAPSYSSGTYTSYASLISPQDGATGVATYVTLDWTGPSTADYWYVQWYSNPTYPNGAYTTATEKTVSLGTSTTYTWKVWSQRSTDNVWGYANTNSFTTYLVSGGGCLLKGTSITLADGTTLPIEKIRAGMELLGFDIENNTFLTETVVYTDSSRAETMLVINDGLLVTTPYDQPIFVRNGDFTGWLINPADLEIGWEVFCPLDNLWVEVTSLEYVDGSFRVYDIGTTAPDNYIANGVLVDLKKK